MTPDPESGKIISFPKQPRSRRRFSYWARALWPFFLMLVMFVLLAIFTHHGSACEPYTSC